MAKGKKDAGLTPEEIMEQAKASMTPEQLDALNKQLNRDGGVRGDGIPKLHRNSQERKDLNGKRIPKGNWVIGQKRGQVDGKDVLEDAGVDLGEDIVLEFLLAVNQYSYYNPDPKKRCNSNICFSVSDMSEAVGQNLGHVCSSGNCHRRGEGLDKKEKCTNQHIVYVRMPEGTKLPDGTDCLIAKMYLSGDNFMPFKEYLDNLSGIPYLAFKTKITGEERVHGAVLYFVNEYTAIGTAEDVNANAEASQEIIDKVKAAEEARSKRSSKAPASGDQAAAPGNFVDAPAKSSVGDTSEPPFNPDDDIPF